jgi:hypothetical protein
MKLWSFSHPHEYSFARAVRVGGTWQSGEYKERRHRLTIEWVRGSSVLGDFSWPGFNCEIVITPRVAAVLNAAGVVGYELRPVDVKCSSWGNRISKALVSQTGVADVVLWDLWITQWVHADLGLSTLERREVDGSVDVEILGAEEWDTASGESGLDGARLKRPRVEGCGMFVRNVRGFFRIEEVPGWIFCADDVKRLLEANRFTNVDFLEVGDIIFD